MGSTRLHNILMIAVLFVIGFVGTLIITIDNGGVRIETKPGPKPAVPIAVGVDGPDRDTKPDDPIILDQEAREVNQNVQKDPRAADFGPGLRGQDTTKPNIPPPTQASPLWPGCSTRFLPVNYSNRVSTVKAIGLHYTAGSNRPGLSDMNGLTGYASSPAAGVSWHFLIDAEGHCYYSVHVTKKAWTIGNLNSETINIEVVQVGNERTYPAGTAGADKLALVVRRIASIYHIPLRVGRVSNCHVTLSGVITHWMGGPCSGGHGDIRPYDLNQVVARFQQPGIERKARIREQRLAQHARTHRRLKACPPSNQSKTCVTLRRRNVNLHSALKKAGR